MGRTGGVILAQAAASDSCMAVALKLLTGVKPFFSDKPRISVPPVPLENADKVSTTDSGSLDDASLTSHVWVSLPICLICAMSCSRSSVPMLSAPCSLPLGVSTYHLTYHLLTTSGK